jgi:hypothetical protein
VSEEKKTAGDKDACKKCVVHVRKRDVSFAPVYTKNDRVAKTGSGQT